MYSRNRISGGEEQYRSNLPPVYSGSRFRSSRQEDIPATDTRRNPPRAAPEKERKTDPLPTPAESRIPDLPAPIEAEKRENVPSAPETEAAEKAPEGLFGSIGQEEAILIALLLLLSAEHERCMDVIIILLLLLGIK